MSVRNIVAFTISFKEEPEVSKMALKFSNVCFVSFSMPPLTFLPLAGSNGKI